MTDATRISIDALVADPASWRPLDQDAAAFGEALERSARESGPPITLSANSFASAAARADGTIVARGLRFTEWCDDQVHRVFDLPSHADRPRVSLIDDRETGQPVAIAAAGHAVARSWPLAANVAAALASGEAAYGLLAFRPDPGRWRTIGRVFGLTGAQTRLVQALTETGDLRSAAHGCGIAYETARKLLASAMARTGAAGQAELIRLTLRLSIGEMPPERPPVALLRDLFGGTER
ncbi:hypothetical protein SPAN111604_09675 [Sphingomonas antarctica]|uniref:helix-turn-helix transcriptional regulator n=1 Tax=Sphingomonas antarctica TaxID=2040274 RepID=UPI0039ECF3B9